MRRPVCGRKVRRKGGGYLTEADIDICQSQRISGLLGSNEAHLHRQWRQSVLINILSASKSQGRWIFEPTFTGIFIAEVESGLQAVKGNHQPTACRLFSGQKIAPKSSSSRSQPTSVPNLIIP